MKTKKRYLIAASVLSAITFAHTVWADVIQTRRGEFHNGIIAQKTLQLATDYGDITLTRDRLTHIFFAPTPQQNDRVTTIDGEVFSGQIKENTFITTRALGPDLPLDKTEIQLIEFEHSRKERAQRKPLEAAPDIIEMNNGDVFLGYHTATLFRVEQDGQTAILPSTEADLLDLTYSEDEEVLKIRLRRRNDQSWLSGLHAETNFTLTDLNGNALQLDLKSIQAIEFKSGYSRNDHPEKLLVSGFKSKMSKNTLRDHFVDGSSGPLLRLIKPGSYLRGDANGDFDEKPIQPVTLTRPFAIGVFEITFAEYTRYCRETDCVPPEDSAWGRGRRPVINVAWEEAKAYTRWLSEKTGHTYRLPSDAEWEYISRAGTTTAYPWGDKLGKGLANCAGCGSIWDSEKTAPVGRFAPNQLGLFDTSGNVFEWVEDCWNDQFEGIGLDGTAYQNPAGCGKRVIRGGGWSFPPKEIRVTNRWRDFPTRRSDDTGFRVLRELNDQEIAKLDQ